MEEIWKNLTEPGLEFYQISNLGHVRVEEREVPTHIVNHGRDMIVTAKRKARDLKVSLDSGRPIVRLRTYDGKRMKKTVPLLVLEYFGEPCPGEPQLFTAGYKDGDVMNNSINNLVWIPRASLASKIGKLGYGIPKEHLAKHKNILVFFNKILIRAYATTRDLMFEFNAVKMPGEYESILRCISEERPLYKYLYFVEVSDAEYKKALQGLQYVNLELIREFILNSNKKIEFKDNLLTQKVKELQIQVKSLTNELKDYKKQVKDLKEKLLEKDEEKKKRLVNGSTTNVKRTKDKAIKTANTKKSRLDDLDDSGFFKEQQELERQKKLEFISNLQSKLKEVQDDDNQRN